MPGPRRWTIEHEGRDVIVTDLLPEHLITAGDIRKMTGTKNRRTLEGWRERRGFPDPVVRLGAVEGWDRRAVEQWLKATGREIVTTGRARAA